MDSNEHGAMEQNEEHLESNILIYYTHETELYAESYDAMNMRMYCKMHGTWRNFGGRRGKSTSCLDRDLARAGRARRPEIAGAEAGAAEERKEAAAEDDGGLGWRGTAAPATMAAEAGRRPASGVEEADGGDAGVAGRGRGAGSAAREERAERGPHGLSGPAAR